MTDASQNRHKKKANGQAEAEPTHEEHEQAGSGRSRRLTVFIITISLVVFSVFVSIAVNYHTKGGYASIRLALLWGMIAYVVLGIGIYFAYYEYVVKPARAAEPTINRTSSKPATIDRPEFYLERVTLDPLVLGEPPIIHLVIKNIGKANAYRITLRTAASITSYLVPGPLPEYIAPTMFMHDAGGAPEILPHDERLTLSYSGGAKLTSQDIEGLNNGSLLMFFSGRGSYEDMDGSRFPFAYCLMYDNKAPTSPIICIDKYWPKDASKSHDSDPERRAWIVPEKCHGEDDKDGGYILLPSLINAGDLPATIKNTRISAQFATDPRVFKDVMTIDDVDQSRVNSPTQPTSMLAPKERIALPIRPNDALVGRVMMRRVKEGGLFLHVTGAVEYETRGSLHYTAFCWIYDPKADRFLTCGGGMN
ncbi:MAG TPA: hypothetical protein VFI24_27550 [Pyrinomonadaceae bacterium]|nr:hypothetical protein [Pyrinomonadaceae bacterium]